MFIAWYGNNKNFQNTYVSGVAGDGPWIQLVIKDGQHPDIRA
jgi:hypothetical protein